MPPSCVKHLRVSDSRSQGRSMSSQVPLLIAPTVKASSTLEASIRSDHTKIKKVSNRLRWDQKHNWQNEVFDFDTRTRHL
ncbi:hypothetical protein ACVIGB_008414 [Bradyrhizobium sp. USDA 4341]